MSRHRTRTDNPTTNRDDRCKGASNKRIPQHQTQAHKLVAPTVALTVALTAPTALAGEREVLTAPEVEVHDHRPGYVVPNLGLSRLPEPIRDIP